MNRVTSRQIVCGRNDRDSEFGNSHSVTSRQPVGYPFHWLQAAGMYIDEHNADLLVRNIVRQERSQRFEKCQTSGHFRYHKFLRSDLRRKTGRRATGEDIGDQIDGI